MRSSGGVDHHPKKIIASNSVKIELKISTIGYWGEESNIGI